MAEVPNLILRKAAVLHLIINARIVRGRGISRIFVTEIKRSKKRIVPKMGPKTLRNLTILRSGIFALKM